VSSLPGFSAVQWDIREGDCLEQLPSLETGSVDIVVTSPPYNLEIDYSTYRDDLPREEYLSWCQLWATEIARVLKEKGSFFLNIGAAPANPLLPHQLLLRLHPLFYLQNTIHWIKSITVTPRNGPPVSAGHFKPLNSKRYITDCHEYIFHLTKSGDVPLDRLAVGVEYADKSNIARWGHTGGKDRRCRGNNWFVPYETIVNRATERPHPATFPVRLAEMCMRLHGVHPRTTMLDPFLGIGNSAVAAEICGVHRFIGFDIDSEYLVEAKARIGI